MKFQLDEKVRLDGKNGVIWDFSHRYGDYDIKLESGEVFKGIMEHQIEYSRENELKNRVKNFIEKTSFDLGIFEDEVIREILNMNKEILKNEECKVYEEALIKIKNLDERNEHGDYTRIRSSNG